MKKESRRNALARVMELASTLPLVGILWKNTIERRSYYEIDKSGAINVEKIEIPKFLDMTGSFLSSLENLCKEYYNEYHECHTVTSACPDGKGGVTTCTSTECNWIEPKNVPKHGVVYEWRDEQKELAEKINYLRTKPVINGESLKNIKVVKRQTGKVGQGILNVAMYGSEIALLLGYEEIAAHIQDTSVEYMSTPSQITRRSFFKGIAALAGAGAAYKLGGKNKEKNEKGKDQLEKEVLTLPSMVKISNDGAFLRYFESKPEQIIKNIENYVQVSKETLGKNVRNGNVRNAFENVVLAGERAVAELKQYFKEGIPQDLGTLANFGHVTKIVDGLSAEKKSEAWEGMVLEGLALAGVMAAIIGPAEYINSKFE